MNDQYGKEIPNDLTCINFLFDLLSEEGIKKIDNLDWYTLGDNRSNNIFVSYSKISDDIGVEVDQIPTEDCFSKTALNLFKLVKIDSVLHRWSEDDGFYHA